MHLLIFKHSQLSLKFIPLQFKKSSFTFKFLKNQQAKNLTTQHFSDKQNCCFYQK